MKTCEAIKLYWRKWWWGIVKQLLKRKYCFLIMWLKTVVHMGAVVLL
jgi:hypothetical protein